MGKCVDCCEPVSLISETGMTTPASLPGPVESIKSVSVWNSWHSAGYVAGRGGERCAWHLLGCRLGMPFSSASLECGSWNSARCGSSPLSLALSQVGLASVFQGKQACVCAGPRSMVRALLPEVGPCPFLPRDPPFPNCACFRHTSFPHSFPSAVSHSKPPPLS